MINRPRLLSRACAAVTCPPAKARPALQILPSALGVHPRTTGGALRFAPVQGPKVVLMAGMSLAEKGLLHLLEKLERREGPLAPSVRYGLPSRGLIEGDPPRLTLKGELALDELRMRPVRQTGEFPSVLLDDVLGARASRTG